MKSLRLRLSLALLTAALSLSACALHGQGKHVATVANVGLYETLAAVQDTADALRQTNVISIEQRRELSTVLLPALETGQQIARVTNGWPADKPAPAELRTLVTQLKTLVDKLAGAWPDSPGKAAILQKVALAQSAVLLVLLAFTS